MGCRGICWWCERVDTMTLQEAVKSCKNQECQSVLLYAASNEGIVET